MQTSLRLSAPRRTALILVGSISALLATQSAQAAARTWVGSTSTDWVTNANWNGGTILNSGDSITFNAAGTQGVSLTNTLTSSAFDIAGITFSASAPAYSLAGNTFNLTAGITNNSNFLQTFNNTGGLTNSVASTFTVSAAGGTTITNGLTDTGAAGLTTTVTGVGGTLTLGSFALNSGAAAAITDTIAGTGNVNITGAVTNGPSGFANGLTSTSTGTVTLGGNNTYTGLTTMNAAGGTLVLSGDNSAATGGLTVTAGTVDLRNTKAIAGTLTGAGSGVIVNGTGSALTLANITSTVVSGGFVLGSTANTGGNGNINFGTGTVSYSSPAGSILMLGTGATFRFDGVATNTSGTSTANYVNGAGNTLVFGNTVVANGTGTANQASTFLGTGNVTFLGAITNGTNSASVNYGGVGTMTFAGNNTYSGSTVLNSGTVILDYSTNPTTKISGSGTGGTLTLAGSVSLQLNAGAVTENVGAWNLNAGANSITRTGGSTGKIITAGLTRGAGSTLALSSGGVLSTTTGTVNSLFTTTAGVVGVVGGNDWMAKAASGSDVVGLSTLTTNYTSNTATTVSGNSDVVTNVSGTSLSATTLRFNGAAARTIDTTGGSLTLTQGGILVTSAVLGNLTTITGGTLRAGSNNALFVFQNNTNAGGGLTIGSTIADGTGGAIALTKSGAGLLSLTNASNSYTGKTYLNEGTLNIAAETSLGVTPGSVTADQLTMNGGTLQFANSIALSANRGLTISGGGNTIDTNGVNGSIAGIIVNGAGIGSLTKTGAGTLTLSAVNTFTGPFKISGGTVNAATFANANGASSIGRGSPVNSAQDLVLDGGTLQYTGVAAASTNRQYILTTNGGGIDASGTSNGSLTFSGAMTASGTTGAQVFTLSGTGTGTAASTISGAISNGGGSNVTSLMKTGTGTWTLAGVNTYTGGTIVSGGTVIATNSSALGSNGGLSVGNGATFTYRPTVAGTLALGSGVLTFAGGSTIGTSVGGGLSGSAITSTAVASATGAIAVIVSSIPGVAVTTGTNNLITAASGLTTGGATYTPKIYNATNFSAANFLVTDTAIKIDLTSQTALTTAFWKGGLSAGTNVWALSDGTTSNWATNAGGTATPMVPGSGADVTFSVTAGATNQGSMVLGADMSIKSLTVSDNNPVTLNADGNTLTIAAVGGITVNSGAGAVTLNAPVTLGVSQTWTNNSTSNLLTVGGNVAIGATTLTVTGSGNTTISGIISGAATTNLTKSGAGTLFLTGANTYSGTATISNSGGILQGSDGAVYTGATANLKTVFGSGTISMGNISTLQLRANGNNDAGAQTLTYGNQLQGAAAGSTYTVDVNQQAATGGTNKTIALGASNVGAGVTMNVTGGNGFRLAIGQLQLGGAATVSTVTMNPTTANLTIGSVGAGSNTLAPVLALDGTSSDNIITGLIANNAATTTGTALTKSNTSTWTLSSGASTYTGLTTIANGTLNITTVDATPANPQSLGENAAVALGSAGFSSGILNYTGGAGTLGKAINVLGNGNDKIKNSSTSGPLTLGGTITKSGTTLTLDGGTQGITVSGKITGTIPNSDLIVSGGTVTLTNAANDYTGLTRITGGTLVAKTGSALGANGGLNISSGATFAYRPTAAGTLTLGTGVVTLVDGSTIGATVAGTLSQSAITSSGAASATGAITVTVSSIPGVAMTSGTHNLLTAGSGLLGGGTATYTPKFYNATNFTATNFQATDTALTLDVTSQTALTAAFWKGGLSGGNNVWALSNGSSASNWTTNVGGTATSLVPGSGADVTFSATGATNQGSMTLGSDMTLKSLTVSDTSPVTLNADGNSLTFINAAAITVSAGAGAVNLNAPIALPSTATISVSSNNGLTLGGSISGAATSLIKAGTGTLTLSGANAFTGSLAINGGTVVANGDTAAVLASGKALTLAGGTFSYSSSNSGANTQTVGTVSVTAGANTIKSEETGAGSSTLTVGNISRTALAEATLNVVTTAGATIIDSAALGVNQGIFYNGANYATNNSVAGGALRAVNYVTDANAVTVATGGAATGGANNLLLGNATSGGATGTTYKFNATGSTLTMSGTAFVAGFLVSGGFTDTVSSASIRPSSSGGADIVVNTNTSTDKLVINSAITFFNNATVSPVAKTGAGVLQLTGANTYNGLTAVNQGTLQSTNASGLGFGGQIGGINVGVGATTVAAGATLDLAPAASMTVNEVITLNGAFLINSGSGTTTIDNGIAAVNLTNLGSGGAASSGTVAITGTGTGATATIAVAAGAITTYTPGSAGTGYTGTPNVTFTIAGQTTPSAATATVSSVSLNGTDNTIGGAGNFNINAVVTDGTSSGGFTKTGAGTVILSGANTYTGPTNVSGGALNITGSINASTSIGMTGGTLSLGASNILRDDAPLTLAGGTFSSGGFSEFVGAGNGTGAGLGGLTLNNNSTVDFAASGSSILWFTSLSIASGKTLTIDNWSGNPGVAGLGGGGIDQLRFTTDPTPYLGQINFTGFGQASLVTAPNGGSPYYEIVAVPEPSSTALLASMSLLGLLGYRRRRPSF